MQPASGKSKCESERRVSGGVGMWRPPHAVYAIDVVLIAIMADISEGIKSTPREIRQHQESSR